MPANGPSAYDFFADFFALCLVLVPIFYLLPWAWARRALLTLTGAYLLVLVAPRLALFYLIFWVVFAGVQRLVAWSGERKFGTYVLSASIIATLAPMVYWKLRPAAFTISFNVFLNNRLWAISNLAGTIDSIRPIILPIGLSFATFRAVDLLVQSYLGTVPPQPLGQILFYGFFPPVQVIGPIIEYSEIHAQSQKTDRLKLDDYRAAFTQVIVGAVKVFVLAVPLASSADVLVVYKTNSAPTIWVELFMYTWFFYLNFSGYSDLAIGTARLFGFRLKPNFSRPLTRTNPQEFWSTWHMSLTRFAQRNIFTPLGGMRQRSQYVAIVATMMTIALWHNISLPLVVFGIYHSTALVGNRMLNKVRPAATEPSRSLVVGKAVLLFVFVAVSIPMLTLSLGQFGHFYPALLGIR